MFICLLVYGMYILYKLNITFSFSLFLWWLGIPHFGEVIGDQAGYGIWICRSNPNSQLHVCKAWALPLSYILCLTYIVLVLVPHLVVHKAYFRLWAQESFLVVLWTIWSAGNWTQICCMQRKHHTHCTFTLAPYILNFDGDHVLYLLHITCRSCVSLLFSRRVLGRER